MNYLNNITLINNNEFVDSFNYNNATQILRIKKANTKISKKNSDYHELFLLSDLIFFKKGLLVKSKKNLAVFKVKQDQFLGIINTLRGDDLYSFLLNYIFFVYKTNYIKLFSKQINRDSVSLSFQNLKMYPYIKEESIHKFKNTYGMDISIILNRVATKQEIFSLFSAYQLFLK